MATGRRLTRGLPRSPRRPRRARRPEPDRAVPGRCAACDSGCCRRSRASRPRPRAPTATRPMSGGATRRPSSPSRSPPRTHESTHDRAVWINRLAADDANIRSAVHWAIDSDEAALALRLVAAVWRYWQVDGHLTEGRELAERAIAMPAAQARTVERMWAVAAAGSLAYWQADSEHARGRYEEQLELARALDHEAGRRRRDLQPRPRPVHPGEGPGRRRARRSTRSGSRYRDLGDERGVVRADWALANVDVGRRDDRGGDRDPRAAPGPVRGARRRPVPRDGGRQSRLGELPARPPGRRRALGGPGLRETYAQRDFGSTTITLTTAVLDGGDRRPVRRGSPACGSLRGGVRAVRRSGRRPRSIGSSGT